MTTICDFTVATAAGGSQDLAVFRGQVLLVVNTASRCGFTPQYAGLQQLQAEYAPQGFSVLGFPCNQFGGQEPGDDAAIAAFCTTGFAVTFPVFAKLEVNGPATAPLYCWLKDQRAGLLGSQAIKWNFTKFLVGRDGAVLSRHAPTRTPEQLRPAIAAALAG